MHTMLDRILLFCNQDVSCMVRKDLSDLSEVCLMALLLCPGPSTDHCQLQLPDQHVAQRTHRGGPVCVLHHAFPRAGHRGWGDRAAPTGCLPGGRGREGVCMCVCVYLCRGIYVCVHVSVCVHRCSCMSVCVCLH